MSKESQSLSLKELLVISRPFWWVNTSVPFVVGALITHRDPSVLLIVGAIYFAIFYNLLMYGINDIYDYETDIKNPRKIAAGIEGSVLAKEKHHTLWLWMIATSVPFWIYFAAVGRMQATAWLVLMIFMVSAYSVRGLRFKEIPLVDSLTSSFHYTTPFIFGVLLFGGSQFYLPAFASFYIWVVANHAFGAIQDIAPDREAGVRSIATFLGSARATQFCLLLYCVAAILPTFYYDHAGLIVTGLLSPYVFLVARALEHRHNDRHKIFSDSWHKFLYLNYIVGGILCIFLLARI